MTTPTPPRHGHHPGIPLLVALLLALLWAIAGYQAWAERRQVVAAKEVELKRLVVAVEEQTLRLLKLTEASVIAAARLAPELSPPIAIRAGSMPSVAAFSNSQATTART